MEVQKKKKAAQMRKRAEMWIREQGLITPGDRVLAGVSGGADSVCLLHMLAEIRDSWGLQLKAVHVNHQLRRGEAERDEAFTKAYCKRLSVEYRCCRVDVKSFAREEGLSEEEAGRILRYRAFEREAEGWEQEEAGRQVKIAVAHHRDDQAETVLFHLFRGSGLKGLGGIPAVRGRVIRPLLSVGREEILAYLREEGLDFCEDSTNFSEAYTRNRIRLQILPMIEEAVNRQAAEHIVQAARRVCQADLYLEEQAAIWLKEHGVTEENGGGVLRIGADAEELSKEAGIIQTYVIRKMIGLAFGRNKDVTAIHVEAVRELLGKQVQKQVDLPCGLRARRAYCRLWLEKKGAGEEKKDSFSLPELEMKVFSYEKGMEIPQNQYTKWLDCDKIKGALSVRTRQTGDYFFLPGGGKKTIKAYMVDEKIPARLRERIPLLADGNHILWIIGRRISEGCKVTDETKKILQVHLRTAGKDEQGFSCQD